MLFRRKREDPDAQASLALYEAVVRTARQPDWYVAGGVPDSVDGRFDMLTLVLSLVLMRLDDLGGDRAARMNVRLTERFVDDFDASMRQIGIGDMMIGKHVGRGMSALGGRLGAYREALASDDEATRRERLDAALSRNLYRGAGPDAAAAGWTTDHVLALAERVGALDEDALLAGRFTP